MMITTFIGGRFSGAVAVRKKNKNQTKTNITKKGSERWKGFSILCPKIYAFKLHGLCNDAFYSDGERNFSGLCGIVKEQHSSTYTESISVATY